MPRIVRPYEWLYELRPVPIKEKVIEEVARHILRDLERWPPPVEAWQDDASAARFEPLYEDPRRPPPALWRRALQLVRWEMEHEYEAIDDTMRNERWREDGGGEQAHMALLLIWRWLTEVLLAVREHSRQALTRADLIEVIDRIEPHLAPDPLRAAE